MTEATVATQINEALDAHRHILPEVTLHPDVRLDVLADALLAHFRIGVGRQEVGRALVVRLLHHFPQPDSLPRVIACPVHVIDTGKVGLELGAAAIGKHHTKIGCHAAEGIHLVSADAEAAAASDLGTDLHGRRSGCGARRTLVGVAIDGVGNFVPEDRRQLVVIFNQVQKAGIDADPVARHHEGVDLARIEDLHIPLFASLWRGGRDPAPDALDPVILSPRTQCRCLRTKLLPGLRRGLRELGIVISGELGLPGIGICAAGRRAENKARSRQPGDHR